MRDKAQMLADALDSPGSCGPLPPEVQALAELGRRLRDACPDADPAFIQSLGQSLQEEWARVARPAGRRVARAAAVSIAVAALLLLAALELPPLQVAARAAVGRVISAFRHARVEVAPQATATPAPARDETYPSVEQAEAAAGFPIRVPSYLPDGMALDEVTVSESDGQRSVALHYSGVLPGPMMASPLIIQEFRGGEAPAGPRLVFEAGGEGVESLQVAGRPALWVQGHWTRTGRWEQGGPDGLLMLQDGDLLIQVAGRLSREECVHVAASMLP
jgi:hypothetical protein